MYYMQNKKKKSWIQDRTIFYVLRLKKKIQTLKSIHTISEYSTRIILQSRIEGETGGIFSNLPFHVSVFPDDKDSPRKLATSCLTSFIFPLA